MGYFNAHHPGWQSDLRTDARRTDLAAQISNSDYGVLNKRLLNMILIMLSLLMNILVSSNGKQIK